jgi:hypothetical protein
MKTIGKRQLFEAAPVIAVVAILVAGGLFARFAVAGPGGGGGIVPRVYIKDSATMTISARNPNATAPDMVFLVTMWAKDQWWTPSCWFNCKGITYTVDPTPILTTPGKDLEDCRLVGVSGITCSSPAGPVWLFITVNTNTAFVTNDVFTATNLDGASISTNACAYANVISQTTASLSAESLTSGASGNYMTGSATTGTASVSWVGTFSQAAAATSTVDGFCIANGDSGAAVLYMEGAYGPVTLVGSNGITTLVLTVVLSRT